MCVRACTHTHTHTHTHSISAITQIYEWTYENMDTSEIEGNRHCTEPPPPPPPWKTEFSHTHTHTHTTWHTYTITHTLKIMYKCTNTLSTANPQTDLSVASRSNVSSKLTSVRSSHTPALYRCRLGVWQQQSTEEVSIQPPLQQLKRQNKYYYLLSPLKQS